MKLLRMTPAHGDVLLAEGDPELAEDEERLIDEFRRQLDLGMWAAVPVPGQAGRREATLVRDFAEVPRDAETVIFFPQAAGGARRLSSQREAERRALELLRTVAGEEPAAMYEQLGFVGYEPPGSEGRYGYLIYAHRPVVVYDAASGELLSELCVKFPDRSSGVAGERLPDADDVLAKWLGLAADERRLSEVANMDPPGRQLDPGLVRRDLETLRRWRARHALEVPA
jgi:hypothetical protein